MPAFRTTIRYWNDKDKSVETLVKEDSAFDAKSAVEYTFKRFENLHPNTVTISIKCETII